MSTPLNPTPSDHYPETPRFRRLSLPELASAANRLLRFQFPPQRQARVMDLLLSRSLEWPKLSKKTMQALPPAQLEAMYQACWHAQTAGGPASTQKVSAQMDNILRAAVLLDDLAQFSLEACLNDDINRLSATAAATNNLSLGSLSPCQFGLSSDPLHAHYLKPWEDQSHSPALISQLQAMLRQFNQPLHWLSPSAENLQDLLVAYWASRVLYGPSPAWTALLADIEQQDPNLLKTFEQLGRLHRLWKHLCQLPETTRQEVDPAGFIDQMALLKGLARLSTLLNSLPKSASAKSASERHLRPIKGLVMVEGATEEIILPVLAGWYGLDLDTAGILLQAAGGKSQVFNRYQQLQPLLRIPILLLLDADARTMAEQLTLRPQDSLFVFSRGETEDQYDPTWILQTIQEYYDPDYLPDYALPEDFKPENLKKEQRDEAGQRVKQLEALWKTQNWGCFDKTDFAWKLAKTLEEMAPTAKRPECLPPAWPALFKQIEETFGLSSSGLSS